MRFQRCALLGMLALLPSLARAQTRDPQAEQLVRAWTDAAGGRNVWDAINDLQYTITTVWYDSTGAERRRRPRYVWVRKVTGGFRVRVERIEPEGSYVQVWDGARAWALLNGAELADTARAVTETRYVAGDLTYWIGLPWKLHDPGVNLSFAAHDAHAPGPVVHVSFGPGVGLHDGDRFWYYFRAATAPFPSEVHYIEQGQPESSRTRVRLDRWGSLQHARYLAQRTIVDAAGRPLRALIISDVKANGGVPESRFRR